MSDSSQSNGRHYLPQGQEVTAIPLLDPNLRNGEPTIGSLVKDATTQMSTLVRAEVELAKAEIKGEVKRGVQGSVFFILALVILLFSSFFFFFFLASLLAVWLPAWAANLIVFLSMVVTSVAFAVLGFIKVRRIKAPAKTIDSLKQAKSVLPKGNRDANGAPVGVITG